MEGVTLIHKLWLQAANQTSLVSGGTVGPAGCLYFLSSAVSLPSLEVVLQDISSSSALFPSNVENSVYFRRETLVISGWRGGDTLTDMVFA